MAPVGTDERSRAGAHRELAVALRRRRRAVPEIAAELGVSECRVRQHLRHPQGLPENERRQIEREIRDAREAAIAVRAAEAEDLYEDGWTKEAIADELDVSYGTVCNDL